jgi:hypothetical protein
MLCMPFARGSLMSHSIQESITKCMSSYRFLTSKNSHVDRWNFLAYREVIVHHFKNDLLTASSLTIFRRSSHAFSLRQEESRAYDK